jgi:hypothetical protein
VRARECAPACSCVRMCVPACAYVRPGVRVRACAGVRVRACAGVRVRARALVCACVCPDECALVQTNKD